MPFTKKKLLLLIILFLTLSPVTGLAASISLSPAQISVYQGETFTLEVNINAEGAKLYTVKAQLLYTPNLLDFSSWLYDSSLIPLVQRGYHELDNSSGNLVRTAGYPGGLQQRGHFGTLTLKANGIGKGIISIRPDSIIFNELSKNIFTGGGTVTVEVLPAVLKKEAVENQSTPNPATIPEKSSVPPIAVEPKANETSTENSRETALFDISAQVAPTAAPDRTSAIFMQAAIGILCGIIFLTILGKCTGKKISRYKKNP